MRFWQAGVDARILGHLHQRAQCDAAVAGLQTVGKLLVALLALVARIERADGVISLASLFAQGGTGKGHVNPVGIVCRDVPASLGKAPSHQFQVLKIGIVVFHHRMKYIGLI